MNIEEVIDQLELRALCYEICDRLNVVTIYHALLRANICSIDDLRSCDLNALAKKRGFGEMRLEFIKEMKLAIEDEEKIQNILEKDNDIAKLRNDADTLYEQVKKLYYEGKRPCRIAEALGISEDAVGLLRWC